MTKQIALLLITAALGFAQELTYPVQCASEPYCTADFLYWKCLQEGQQYIADYGASTNLDSDPGRVFNIDYEWSPGFRVGLGWGLPLDGGDLYANYTSMKTHSHSSHKSESLIPYPYSTFIYDFFFRSNTYPQGMTPIGAEGKWDCLFQTLDLGWGRNFYVSEYLTTCPRTGLKGAWIDQKLTKKWLTTIGEFLFLRKEDFKAVGMRFGLDTHWRVSQSWGFYNRVYASLMWSRYDLNAENLFLRENAPEMTNLSSTEKLSVLRPVYEIGLGLQYQTGWKAYLFQLNVGWEAQVWKDHNYFLVEAPAGTQGSLVLQGLTTNFRFDF